MSVCVQPWGRRGKEGDKGTASPARPRRGPPNRSFVAQAFSLPNPPPTTVPRRALERVNPRASGKLLVCGRGVQDVCGA